MEGSKYNGRKERRKEERKGGNGRKEVNRMAGRKRKEGRE
jgi:hypothetical protein